MHLIWEPPKGEDEDEYIMMVCSNQNEYMVFDERDSEESTLLRKVRGGH